jgi:hypothetical protein
VSGSHRWVRAFRIDPATATPAFVSEGSTVAIASNQDVACLLRADEADQCYYQSNIAAGRGFSIDNDCSVGSARRMVIAGFVPQGATQVEIAYSDGSVPFHAEVVRDAFRLVGRTPRAGEPYPVSVRSLEHGTELTNQEIPGGDHLCMTP